MTTQVHDQLHDRRELTAALLRALDRRHEVLDAIIDSEDYAAALTTVARLLDTTEAYAEAVLNLTFRRLTKFERLRIQSELKDLDATLEWTALDRPASTGRAFRLRPFTDTTEDAELFRRRCAEQFTDQGVPWPETRVDRERSQGLQRIDEESAAWFVAEDTAEQRSVGLVFGELSGREVDVAVWIAPDSRKKGYGTAAVKLSRRELAAEFPGTTLIVRAPGLRAELYVEAGFELILFDFVFEGPEHLDPFRRALSATFEFTLVTLWAEQPIFEERKAIRNRDIGVPGQIGHRWSPMHRNLAELGIVVQADGSPDEVADAVEEALANPGRDRSAYSTAASKDPVSEPPS